MAYLVISVMTGLGFAAVGFLGFGTGFWATILWYVAGCWAGFAVCFVLTLIGSKKQTPRVALWPDNSAAR